MNTGSLPLRFALGWLLAATPLIFTGAQAQEPGGAQSADEPIEEIITTGSRIPRAGFDTLMPAIVVDGEFLKDRGITDVATALNELPAFGFPGNSTLDTQSTYSIGQNFVNLYGLGSQRTLTLVNGRRFVSGNSPSLFVGANAGAQVDLNMIPTALVDRIETISIGGAPIYGADAIAGTVNVIMKQDFEGFDLASSYGVSAEDEMEETVVSVAWGANSSDGRGNVSLAVEFSDRAGMIASKMPHLAKGWQFRDTGDETYDLTLIERGTANIVSNNGVATPIGTLVPSLGLGGWPDGSFLQFSPDGTLVPYDIGTATANAVWSIGGEGLFLPDVESLYTPLRRTIATAFGRYELSPDVEVFTEFWAAQSRAVEVVNQPAYQSGLFSAESESLLFSVDHPLLSQQARDTIVGYGFDNFYLQRASTDLRPDGNRTTGKTNLLRGVIGLRGEFTAADRDFTWDASYNRGRTDTINGSTEISNQRFFYALDAVVADDGSIQCRVVDDPSSRPNDPADLFGTFVPGNAFTDCVPLDLFGQGRPSQEALNYIGVVDYASTVIDQEVFEVNLGTTDLFDLPAGGFGVNFGLTRRTEAGSFETSGFTQLGLGRSTPVLPVSGEFESNEGYLEFYAPLFSEDMDIPGIEYMTMEGAYRYLDNDFAGYDDAWTVGLKYSPISDLEIRGNVTRSVRAPAITELFLPLSGTFTFSADPCDAVNIDAGPNPSARAANCASGGGGLPGITQPFTSTVRNASVEGLSGGNTGLNNETADAWTVGIILRPRFAEGLQLSIDYIDFDIEDAIETFTLTELMQACYDAADFPNRFCSDFRRLPTGQVPPREAFTVGKVNAGARTYQAFTAEALYSFDALQGQFDVSGTLLNIRQFDETLLGTTTDFKGELRSGASEWQWNATARYSRDNWSAFLQPRYIGEGIFDNDASENQRSISGNDAVWYWNGGFSYDINDQIGVQLNINNMFDELPRPATIARGDQFIYDNIGRFYRLSLRVSL